MNWSLDNISAATCLHSAGPRAYRFLCRENVPLPGTSTLRQWAIKISVRPGILQHVLKLMSDYSLSNKEKICVLSFDEMKIKFEYDYDKANDVVLKPTNYVQVAMVRGLLANWKQPIFYEYDCKMTGQILKDIILSLDAVGFCVVAIVSDMGATNQAVWRELGINLQTTWFQNPANHTKKMMCHI